MKINLGCGNDIRSGYVNVDRLPPNQMPPEIYRQGDIQSLDWLTEDDTAEEIVSLDCLEYLPINSVQSALANWVKKLVSGGVIKILVPDCHAIAKSFYQGQFSLQEFRTMIFGTQENNDNRLSAIDAITLTKTLEELGLTVSTKRYDGIAIYVEAIK